MARPRLLLAYVKPTDHPPASNPPGPFIKRCSSDSAGWALVVVLSLVALISFLLVAILAGSRSELSMTAAYAQVQESRTLVDSTVNTVIAEIREASTTADTAWISQPGLIRTFDASGNEATAYKLYSAAEMIVPAGFNPAANLGTEVPADWLTRTTEFVDLNEPVTVDGDVVFPILDPAAEGIIEGFKNQVAATSVATSAENPMPMPVRWLYVLEDGTYRPKIGNTIAGAMPTTNLSPASPSGPTTNPARSTSTPPAPATTGIRREGGGTFLKVENSIPVRSPDPDPSWTLADWPPRLPAIASISASPATPPPRRSISSSTRRPTPSSPEEPT